MKPFTSGQRVRVLSGLDKGKLGTVGRTRIRDTGAWITLDDQPHEDTRQFPADDSRGNHVLLYPEDCEEV